VARRRLLRRCVQKLAAGLLGRAWEGWVTQAATQRRRGALVGRCARRLLQVSISRPAAWLFFSNAWVGSIWTMDSVATR
jgi:hypothetical protein